MEVAATGGLKQSQHFIKLACLGGNVKTHNPPPAPFAPVDDPFYLPTTRLITRCEPAFPTISCRRSLVNG
jgi:hypothetical protein